MTDVEMLKSGIKELSEANDARLVRCAQGGVGVDQASLNSVRILIFLEHLLGGKESAGYLQAELAVQQRYAELIDNVEAQVSRSRLLNGVRLDGGGS